MIIIPLPMGMVLQIPIELIIRIAIILLVVGTAFGVLFSMYASYCVFSALLIRKNEEKWGRVCSSDEPEMVDMFEKGLEWGREHASVMKELHIINEGFNLYGEYYDFGSDKCVIILPGRAESLKYSYFFAKPYSDLGINVLVVDQRAHGLSDGRVNTLGYNERTDVLAWADLVHRRYGVKSVIIHGICIGSACGVYAMADKNCPDYIDCFVAEGLYDNFRDNLKNNLKLRKKPIFPVVDFFDMFLRLASGTTINKGPGAYISSIKKPVLMIHSKEDTSSSPLLAERLYDNCGSEKKEMVWFEEGTHSRLRYEYTEKYDESVKTFICAVYPELLCRLSAANK